MATILKSTCIFCLKPAPEIKPCTRLKENVLTEEYNCSVDKEIKHFLKCVNRYICADQKEHNFLAQVSCSDCLEIIKSFNKLYHEIECLKLKINWEILKLKNKAEYANRIPSRFHRITSKAALEEKSGSLKEMLLCRQSFIDNCTIHLSKSTPKVILKSNQLSQNTHNDQVYRKLSQVIEASDNEAKKLEAVSTNTIETKVEPVQFCEDDDSISIANTFSHNTDQIKIELDQYPPPIQQDEPSLSILTEEVQHPYILPDPLGEPDETPEHEAQVQQTTSKKITKTFNCSYCPIMFSNLGKLVRHKWFEHTHKGQKPRDQVIIQETSTTIGEWVNKTGAKYKCSESICTNVTFMTEEGLQDHSKLHGSFSCKFCGEVKNFAPDLATHELEMHGKCAGPSKSQQCPRCPNYYVSKSLPYQSYLNHHLSRHQKLYVDCCRCPLCKHAFFAKTNGELERNLLVHWLTIHDKSSSQDCAYIELSGVRVRGPRNINNCRGNDLETETKMPQCQICKKSFKHESQVKRHYFTHNLSSKLESSPWNWKFECKVCGKKFWDSYRFKRHQQTQRCAVKMERV